MDGMIGEQLRRLQEDYVPQIECIQQEIEKIQAIQKKLVDQLHRMYERSVNDDRNNKNINFSMASVELTVYN